MPRAGDARFPVARFAAKRRRFTPFQPERPLAVTPETNQAFLREVDEELRRDRVTGLWTRWGRWIIAAIVAGLALFAGYLYWQHRQTVAAGEEGEQLQVAFDQLANGQAAAASDALGKLAQSDRPGYRALAVFTQADVLIGRGDLKGAAAKFAAVAADESQPAAFRDLATVRRAAAEFDTAAPQVTVDRLRAIAVPANPYFGSAGEMMAMAYVRQKRPDLAGRLFAQIAATETVPATIRQRAVQMAGLLGGAVAPAPAAGAASRKDSTR